MIEIKLLDEKWMEETINVLLNTEQETVTKLEEDVCQGAGYQAEVARISAVEKTAMGTTVEDMLSEYKDAIESQAGYHYNAAYLNGLKRGFQMAMFLKRD